MGTVILRDVPPYVTVSGNSASPHGINSEGLKRRGYSSATIMAIRRAYKTLYKQGKALGEATAELEEQAQNVPEIALMTEFLKSLDPRHRAMTPSGDKPLRVAISAGSSRATFLVQA